MKCFVCGMEIREEASFCPYCGKNQNERPAEHHCVHCGQVIRAEAKFCGHCGGEQIKLPEPAVEEPVVVQEPVVGEVPAELAAEEPVVAAPVEPVPVFVPTPPPAPVQEPVYRYNPEPVYRQPNVVQPAYQMPMMRPAFQLPTERALWKMILLSILTLGIYPMVIWSKISMEINVVASRQDGKWTMHFLWMCFLAPLTLGIYPFVWIHELCNRIGEELQRRRIDYQFSAATFWLWNLLYFLLGFAVTAALAFLLPKAGLGMKMAIIAAAATSVISIIGPFVYLHKNMKAMNLLNADYNEKG